MPASDKPAGVRIENEKADLELIEYGEDGQIIPNVDCGDRNAITNGKLNHLTEDLKLHGNQYNTAISILFCGYLGQIPSNMILTRVRPSVHLAGFAIVWSLVSGLMAVFYLGALYLLSIFYTKKDLSLRVALSYTGNIAANAFCGLIAAAVFATLDSVHGLAGWRWLFIITGVVSFGIGLLSLFALPDTPLTTWWVSEEEHQLAHDRVKRDTTEHDCRTWLFCFNMNMQVSAESFKYFIPSVVQTLGFNTTVTLALTCPPYVVSGFAGAALSWSSGKRNERTWHMIIGTFLDVVGFAMAASTTNIAVRYVGMVIFVSFSSGVNDICLGWATSTLGQTPEKKAISMALIYISAAPLYITGMSSSAAFSVAVILATWFTRVGLKRDNERIRQTAPETTVLYAY
ncbi:major facilitator superfamily domain-containing protein [Lipomyces starkeyi]